MNATLRLLATRRAVTRSIIGQINRLQALDHDLGLALQAEPKERQDAVLSVIAESDNAVLAKLEGVGGYVPKKQEVAR